MTLTISPTEGVLRRSRQVSLKRFSDRRLDAFAVEDARAVAFMERAVPRVEWAELEGEAVAGEGALAQDEVEDRLEEAFGALASEEDGLYEEDEEEYRLEAALAFILEEGKR